MGMLKNYGVRVYGDFSSLVKQSQKAQKAYKQFSAGMTADTKKLATAGAMLKKTFAVAGAAMGAIMTFSGIQSLVEESQAAMQNEVTLAQVMRNTMEARQEDVESILELIDAQERLGVVDGQATLAGSQELATYLTKREALEHLIPVMNDMLAQQYGLNATEEAGVSIGTMLGKVMNGQVSALSRLGYTFDETQQQVLLYGDEMERAAVLADVVKASVGGVNEALGKTDAGQMKQVSAEMGQLREEAGALFEDFMVVGLPVARLLISGLHRLVDAGNAAYTALSRVFGFSAGKDTGDYLASIGNASDGLATCADNLAGEVSESVKTIERATAGFDKLNILKAGNVVSSEDATVDDVNTPTVSGVLGSTGLEEEKSTVGAGIAWLENRIRKAADYLERTFSPLVNPLKNLWDSGKKIGELLHGLATNPFVTLVLGGVVDQAITALAVGVETFSAALDIGTDALYLIASFLLGDFSSAAEYARNILDRLGSWARNVFIAILGEDCVVGVENFLASTANGFSSWWTGNVAPWFTAARWKQLWSDVKTGWNNGWSNLGTSIANSEFGRWWSSSVSPWFTAARWKQLWSDAKTGWNNGWSNLSSSVANSSFGQWWSNSVSPWFTAARWKQLWSDAKTGFTAGFTNLLKGGQTLINKFIDKINSFARISWNSFDILGEEIIPAGSITLFRIPQVNYFAEGGFPRMGELFVANESGPELVGRFGSRTAVANRDQITSGIAQGVAYANYGVIDAIYEMTTRIVSAVLQSKSDIIMDGVRMNRRLSEIREDETNTAGTPVTVR